MVEIKLLGRVKYQDTFYSANDVISVNKETAEYLKGKKLCEVRAVIEPVKEQIEEVKPVVKKSKKAKQEG